MASVEKFRSKWRVRWYDASGRQRSKSYEMKRDANGFKAKIEHELAQGTYLETKPKRWGDFVGQYKSDSLTALRPKTQKEYLTAIEHFERICKPRCVSDVDEPMLDKYKAARAAEDGFYDGSKVAPATINKELRSIKAVLGKAKRWKCIKQVPDFEFVREPEKLPRFMTEQHFEQIYQACNAAKKPHQLPYDAPDWWRGLLVFIYFTGWRISEPTALLRRDVDLDNALAITRHTDNKGKRDEAVRLHPVVVDHLELLKSFHVEMFPWPHGERELYREWHRIQDEARIVLECPDAGFHECNRKCRYYGFHDIRRAFATVTGAQLTADDLQRTMRHKAYATTQRYINDRERALGVDVSKLQIPGSLARKSS